MRCCPSGPPRPPTFNLLCNIWWGYFGIVPPAIPFNLVSLCQLQLGERVTSTPTIMTRFLLLPKLTDIHYLRGGFAPDLVEFPAGSGRFYTVLDVDDVGKGFTNEYRQATMNRNVLPFPLP